MSFPTARAKHFNDTLTSTTPKIVDVGKLCVRIHIRNTGSNVLDISFDGGANFYSIAASGEFSETVSFSSFWVNAPSGNTTYTSIVLCM